MHLCERLVSTSNDCLLADLRLIRLSTDSQSNEASVKSLNKKTKRKKKLRKAKQSYNNTNSKQKKSISWKVERLLSLIYSCGWPPLSKVLCLRVTSGSGLTFLLKVRCREFYDKLNEWRTHWFLFVISGRTDIYMTSPSTSISFVIIKKKIHSILPWVCTVTYHGRRQIMVTTLLTNSAARFCATFLFCPHFNVICDLLLNRHTKYIC